VLAIRRAGIKALMRPISADKQGNVASWTGTIQAPFGSFLLVNGYLLNNELTDFAFVPRRDGKAVANRAEGGKRPRSSMSPTIVFDVSGKPIMALGSAGGSRIIAHVLKTLIAHLDWGMDVQHAIDYPNFFKTAQGLEIEPGSVAQAVRAGLEAKGHKVIERQNVSGLTGLTISETANGTRTLMGGADSRREGIAIAD
jgi:gamma-glutamyltranspeptidase / glutathione hydrolase